LGRTVTIALAHDLDEAAARLLDGIARVKLQHAVAARDLPVGTADHLATHLWARKAAATDIDHAPLAERRGPHADELADIRLEIEQEFELQQVTPPRSPLARRGSCASRTRAGDGSCCSPDCARYAAG